MYKTTKGLKPSITAEINFLHIKLQPNETYSRSDGSEIEEQVSLNFGLEWNGDD